MTTGNPQAERDHMLFAKLGLHPERRYTVEDEALHAERLTQQAQQHAQAERAAALAVDVSQITLNVFVLPNVGGA